MTKTLRVGYAKDAQKVTLTSTAKKLYGTMIWIDASTGNYYSVERTKHLGRTVESASPYNLTKEQFEEI